MAKKAKSLNVFDPYDLWSMPLGVNVREKYYRGSLVGKVGAITLGLLDWLTPQTIRWITKAKPRPYPIVIAHEVLRLHQLGQLDEELATSLFSQLSESAAISSKEKGTSWGLGFSWMSKNGLYPIIFPLLPILLMPWKHYWYLQHTQA